VADSTELAGEARGPGFLARSSSFLTAVRAELRKVTWPTREELQKATRMIVILSVVLGVAIGIMDVVLQKILVDGVARLAR
jgi:preprotein translocase subunit SecE